MKRSVASVVLLALALSSAVASAATFEASGPSIRALEADRVLWEHRHTGDPDLKLQGPVPVGEHVYYVALSTLYDLDAATGHVRRRILLPAVATGLEADGDGVRVTAGTTEKPQPWSATWHVGPEASEVPFFLNASLKGAFQARREASTLVQDVKIDGVDAPKVPRPDGWWKDPKYSRLLEAALLRLEALRARDATNPWIDLERAEYLSGLKRTEEAARAYAAVLEHDPSYDYELIGMARRLDAFDPKLGDQAFDRAMRFLLGHGYEPELSLAVLTSVIQLGTPGDAKKLDPQKDLERLTRFGARLWDFAPIEEGASFFYTAMGRAYRDAGDAAQAAVWEQRAEASRGYSLFGGAGAEATGYAIEVVAACLIAIFTLFVVKSLRNTGRRIEGRFTRWLLPGRWSRLELVGMAMVYVVLVLASLSTARGVASIGVAAAAPMTVGTGSLGHPESVAFWQKATDDAALVKGLSLLHSGQLEAAAAMLAKAPGPEAKVDLGVVRHRQGKADEARALWEQALAEKPDLAEAAHNLGRAARSARVERAKRYGIEGPLLAMPTLDHWRTAWIARAEGGSLPDLLEPGELIRGVLALMDNIAGDDLPAVIAVVNGGNQPLGYFALLFLITLPAAFVVSRREVAVRPSKASRLGWALGFVIPGSARQLNVAGPLLLVAFLFTGQMAWMLAHSDGYSMNVLDAIAVPDFGRYFGIADSTSTPFRDSMRTLAGLWWVPLALNVALLAVAEKVRPDPAGPFYRAKA